MEKESPSSDHDISIVRGRRPSDASNSDSQSIGQSERRGNSRTITIHMIGVSGNTLGETKMDVEDSDPVYTVLRSTCERWGIMEDRYMLKLHDQANAIPATITIGALGSITDLDLVRRGDDPNNLQQAQGYVDRAQI